MIISCVGQKGGGSKSTHARTLYVGFTDAGWKTHLADIDEKQQTSLKWAQRREQANLGTVDCALYRRVDTAVKMADKFDLLIIDGRPAAETTSLDVAENSDLVIISTGTSIDDLEPSLELARELIKKGISREKIVFSVAKSPSDSEGRKAKATIQEWNFAVLETVIPFKSGYSSALDSGRALFETPFKTLNEVAKKMVEEIHDIIN
ncbi:dna-binding plasmid partition protein [Rouxiella silvae]|uniref:Dna-binding plasmid partition protein n=1 Tax=Rouxiella silvae TaxID=1646373 RepID=A0ABX3TTX9_9GAMM|nr:ParA family protein [Rouxiella silvae]ORJ18677.1 dna-binding plasmid partition protein [Rouxiella silvae]